MVLVVEAALQEQMAAWKAPFENRWANRFQRLVSSRKAPSSEPTTLLVSYEVEVFSPWAFARQDVAWLQPFGVLEQQPS